MRQNAVCLLMIFRARADHKGAVDLLRQNDAHELMRKGHLRKGEQLVRARLHALIQPAGGADDEGDLPPRVRERAEHTIAEIADIVRFTEIPTDLGEYGVKASDMDFLVEAAYGVRRLLDNNMKDMTREDIRGVYQKVMA